ncbi:MAG: DUF4388 domain-containing protein [Desulfatiglandales bacterium]
MLVSKLNSEKMFLSTLLLQLYHGGTTGVLTVKDNRRTLKLYFKSGNVVYADGIDTDRQLLKKIAVKKRLDENQLDELKDIKEKDPQSFGKTLMERKLLSQSGWRKFVELKVKHILGVGFQMDAPDIEFTETALNIPPVNFIDYNMVQLVVDAIRGIKKLEHFKKYVPGDDAIFGRSGKVHERKANIPLNPSEQTLFSVIDGQNTVGDIQASTGFDEADVNKILYLFLNFGLITLLSGEAGEKRKGVDYGEIVNIYIDLLKIIETNLRKEIGHEFEGIFQTCKDELTGESKDLLYDFNLTNPPREGIVKVISRRFAKQGKATEGRLFLVTSFNKLTFLVLMRMKKVLGLGLTEKTLEEMMKMLEHLEKYRQDAEMIDYFRKNLEDYLQQMQS